MACARFELRLPKAKKDIYCEKPMAHTILEGSAMVEAVRSNQRVLQVAACSVRRRNSGGLRVGAKRSYRHGESGGCEREWTAPVLRFARRTGGAGAGLELVAGAGSVRAYKLDSQPARSSSTLSSMGATIGNTAEAACVIGARITFDIVQWAFGLTGRARWKSSPRRSRTR